MERLLSTFQFGIARTRLREQIDCEHGQHRVDRVPVTRLRETHIVNQWKEDQQASKQENAVHAVADGEKKAREREQGSGEKQRRAGLLQAFDDVAAGSAAAVEDQGPEEARNPV